MTDKRYKFDDLDALLAVVKRLSLQAERDAVRIVELENGNA